MIGTVIQTKNCGPAVVVEYKNAKEITVRFEKTGTEITTTMRVLRRSEQPRLRDPLAPTVFGVGRIGAGPYPAHDGTGADTHAFSIWRAMLRRCYYEPERRPWREGQTVAPEWHDFQNFAEWFEANYPQDGKPYQLDKDLRISNNKVYGPEACGFVTQAENLAGRKFARRKT